jgi:hypothetical protein
VLKRRAHQVPALFPRARTRRAGCFAVLTLAGAGTGARAQSSVAEDVAVTPYRPTVSTPASLSAPGWLEVEAGLQRSDLGAPTRRDSVPYSLKLAISDDWGIRIGGEGWVRDVDVQDRRVTGGGDTSVILKRRFAVNERSAFGLELGATAPTARAGLHSGSGSTDYAATWIYSTDLGSAWHADLNVGVTRLGSAGPAEGRRQALWAAALTDAVGPRWGVAGEYSGTRRTGASATGQILFAATYSADKRVTLDFGIARGTTAATPAWTMLAGCTVLVSRLF